ncbi:MAG: efflux RND transporter permease subunit [Spirochaetales bacterium]|nr:efflux RND transporter permease subunit [Spirochaetales bacterium]
MFLSNLSIKRPILVTMFLMVFVIFGALAYFTLPLSLFPDVKMPYIFIQTVYEGSSPDVIESQITKRIEDAVSSLGDLREVTSYSMESLSLVSVQFNIGKDEEVALSEVKDAVDQILNDLPDGADKPISRKLDINNMTPIMSIVLNGSMSATELYTLADQNISDSLAQAEDVGQVNIIGGLEREIRIEFDKMLVFENMVSLPQIAGLLDEANSQLPGGSFKQPGQDLSVRMSGEFISLEEIGDIDIPVAGGTRKLGQLADILDSNKTVRTRTLVLDKQNNVTADNAILLQIIRTPNGNTVQGVREVTRRLPLIEAEYGHRIQLSVLSEQATFVQDSVDDTVSNVYMGIILTGLILLFFLHDLRSTIIVAISMPFSIVSTFMIMQYMGISLNMMSLMGLSTATGVLVANSVVVLENIFRMKEEGHNRVESAAKGTSEVVVAVMASALTNICVFFPLANVSGMVGMMLQDFALTTVIATVFSILVSFTVTPMLASLILPESIKKEWRLSIWLEKMFKAWERWYERLLKLMMKNRKRCFMVVLVTILIFAGSMAFVVLGFIPFELSPNIDGGLINVNVELPQGYDLDETAAVLDEVQSRLKEYPDVLNLVTTLGRISFINQGVNQAQMQIKLTDREYRDKSNVIIAAEMTRTLADIPNADIKVNASSAFGGGGQAPVSFYLQGQDMDALEELAAGFIEKMHQVPGFINIDKSSRPGKPEITMKPDRKKLSEEGISVYALALTLRGAVEGIEATKYKDAGNEYDIRVVFKDSALLTYEDLASIPVMTPSGPRPISYFADIDFTTGFNLITRVDKFKTITISSYLLPGFPQGSAQTIVNEIAASTNFPTGYKLSWGGNARMLLETMQDMGRVFVIAVVLTYMLLAAILESFVQPLLILATVPLAFIGIIAIILLTNTSMNMASMLAIIMLVGIVVNNAILILDYMNLLRREGLSVKEALIIAGPRKLKPILMSNIATVLGMLPMALAIGSSGAEMRQAMGIVSIGGILSSTVLTLFIIPAIEYIFARKQLKKRVIEETPA